MIISLKKAFRAYSEHPFTFVWGTLVYLLFQVLFLLCALGLLVILFFVTTLGSMKISLNEPGTQLVIGVIGAILLFFMCGMNAALMRAYANALNGVKISVREFLEYLLQKSAMIFAIMIIRELITLLLVAPVVAIWWYYLKSITYSEVFVTLYSLFMLFIVHMLFTPAMLSAGVFGSSLIQSLKNGFGFLRRKHVFFIFLYALFALIWLLNFIPFVQLVTLFVLYPVIYSAMIIMVQDMGKKR